MKIELETKTTKIALESILSRVLSECPGVIRISESGAENKLMWHVSPILGETFGQAMRRGLSRERILEMGSQILQTLECMHRKNFVYSDLKPENILWDPAARRWTLIDLGSATPPIQLNRYAFNGTPNFASLRSLEAGGAELSDDIEALMHVVEWGLRGGRLPWTGTELDSKAMAVHRRSLPPLVWSFAPTNGYTLGSQAPARVASPAVRKAQRAAPPVRGGYMPSLVSYFDTR